MWQPPQLIANVHRVAGADRYATATALQVPLPARRSSTSPPAPPTPTPCPGAGRGRCRRHRAAHRADLVAVDRARLPDRAPPRGDRRPRWHRCGVLRRRDRAARLRPHRPAPVGQRSVRHRCRGQPRPLRRRPRRHRGGRPWRLQRRCPVRWPRRRALGRPAAADPTHRAARVNHHRAAAPEARPHRRRRRHRRGLRRGPDRVQPTPAPSSGSPAPTATPPRQHCPRRPSPPGHPVAYVASGEDFPDGIAAGAVAGRLGGPVLLTARGALPPRPSPLARLRPRHGRRRRRESSFPSAFDSVVGVGWP